MIFIIKSKLISQKTAVEMNRVKDLFKYPIDWEEIDKYNRQILIRQDYATGKRKNSNYRSPNFRRYQEEKEKNCTKKCRSLFKFNKVQQKYGKYGPNCVIFFGFIGRISIFFLFLSVFVGFAFIALNSSSQICFTTASCLGDNLAYRLSLFNLIEQFDIMLLQTIVWLILSFIICGFLLYLRIHAINKFKKINNINITQGDYSIILRRIPQSATQNDIRDFIKQQLKNQIVHLFPQCKDKIYNILNVEQVILLKRMDLTQSSIQQLLDQYKKKISQNKQSQIPQFDKIKTPTQFSGTALVIFSSIEANDYIDKVISTKCYERSISYFFPFNHPRSQFCIKGKKISINRAPEPTDILWTNIGYTQRQRIRRKIFFSFNILILITISATVSYFLTLVTMQIQNNFATFLVLSALFFFNWGIQFLLKFVARGLKMDTKTDLVTEKFKMTVFNQGINLGFFYIILPFIIKYPYIREAFTAANFPKVLLTTLSVITFVTIPLTFLIDYFNLTSKILKYLLKNKYLIKTHFQAKQLTKGPQILFSQKYADLVQLFWFGIVFSIVAPVCIIISAIGFMIYYIFQRILFAKAYAIPCYTRLRVSLTFINSLQYVVLHIGLTNFFLYLFLYQMKDQNFDGRIFAITIINIGLGACFNLMPWDQILQKLNINIYSDQNQKSYQQIVNQFKTKYNDLNPAGGILEIQLVDKIYNNISKTTNVNKVKNNPEQYGTQRQLQ